MSSSWRRSFQSDNRLPEGVTQNKHSGTDKSAKLCRKNIDYLEFSCNRTKHILRVLCILTLSYRASASAAAILTCVHTRRRARAVCHRRRLLYACFFSMSGNRNEKCILICCELPFFVWYTCSGCCGFDNSFCCCTYIFVFCDRGASEVLRFAKRL